ncbi:MAG: tetratricopeptide repeat protein [Gemmataceae bacterium]
MDPTDPKAHSNLGIALREAGDVPGAITAFKEVIERDPQSAEAHFDLGNVMQSLGNIDAAIGSFEEAAFLSPETAVLHVHLAVVYLLRKRNEEAIAAAKEAIWRNPLDPCADLAHGIILFAQGDSTAGRLAFEEAVRQEPERWEVSFRQLFPSAPSPVGPLD